MSSVFDPDNLKLLAPTFYKEWRPMKINRPPQVARRGPNKATAAHLAQVHSLAVGEKVAIDRDGKNMRMVLWNNKHHPAIDGKKFHIQRTSSTTCTIQRIW